jgi:hypothetical protein
LIASHPFSSWSLWTRLCTAAETRQSIYKNPYQAPHMVVRFDDTVFTTVMVFLPRLNRSGSLNHEITKHAEFTALG